MGTTKEDLESEVRTLQPLIAEEFKLIGFNARPVDIARLADALAAQGAEYDEIAIMSACVGYGTARGMNW